MRIHPIPLITVLLLFFYNASAQKSEPYTLQLRSGAFIPEKNITSASVQEFSRNIQKVNGQSFAVIQFDQVPSAAQKQELQAAGIELLEYIPDRAYTVSIRESLDANLLQRVKARAVFTLSAEYKMHPAMAKGIYPSWAIRTPGMVDVWVSFPKTFSFEEIKQLLAEKNFQVNSEIYKDYKVIGLRVHTQRIIELASLPFIEYAEPAPHGDQLLNYESKLDSRAHILNSATTVGGFNLKGEGVVTGIGDNADPQYHIDFNGRIIDFGPAGYAYHGTHVHGTVGGAGIANPWFTGYAPKATLITQYFSGIINNAPAYVSDYGMVVTNNSYGDVTGDCSYMGYYDLTSRILDLQAASLPNLQHVFAAGNDGGLTCSPYPSFFGTVLSSYQSAKNTLVVGATDRGGAITSFSSRGPVKDGRIKPEITADGFNTISTIPDDGYGFSSGTSMASPAVAGGLTLLYQRYRQLNGSANPKSGLMKALICNGGADMGNTGPDFTNGFGWMNLLRSVDMLNNNRYFISSVSHSGSNNHTITGVPAGTAQLKVLLYWTDPAAAAFASQTLVNDLDMEITSPSSVLPWILDTVPSNVTNSATTGADHINNIEQITINNPSGDYTITVSGTSVPSGPQEYYLVYDIIPTETRLVYPIGGESFDPGSSIDIRWESYGSPNNTFTVEYSINNGASWTTISSMVAANLRKLNWTLPSVQTDEALVRVTRNGTGYVSTSAKFTILGTPVVSLASTQCEGYIALNWTAVTGAVDYEVFLLQNDEMVAVGTTSSTNYTLSGLSPDSVYWVAVRARLATGTSVRSVAISRQPNGGTCAGSISDNDIRLDSITAPVYGRLLTSTALSATTTISARIKNLDNTSISNFDMRYSVNGGPWVLESVAASVAGGATYTHTFAATFDFSAAGTYTLTVEVINTGAVDPVTVNNSRTDTIRQLSNAPITLPFTDDLETAVSRKYYTKRFGVAGVDRYDFTNTDPLGRLSTYLSSGMAYSGSKSLIMDYDGWNGGVGSSNFVYGTYNLAGYDASTDELRLDFQFKIHGDSVPHATNKIWIRGDDTQPWIEAFNLSANGNDPGIFIRTPSIELSDLLIANSQNFSSSFQVRFGQFGIVRINDNDGFQGHNFDDIRIYQAVDDIQLISIDTPIVNSCGLSSTTPVMVTVKNSAPVTINNIPIKLVVDGGVPVTETIASIAANTTIQYTFTATADLAALGNHSVVVYVDYATDNFRDNDTARVDLVNTPLVNSFPYLENFEGSDGYWYASGKNSSWEYGTPASTKISRAASGTKAWKTNLTGNYNDKELSYLYSPCFDISGMTRPTLSFSAALDLEDCGGSTFCDGAYVEFSGDGKSWFRLGTSGSGTNWYNRNYSSNPVWSVENYTRWHVVTASLPSGYSKLRLRIVVSSDPFVNFEGIGVDDIHIYDNMDSIYNGATMGSPVTQNISGGTSWIDFKSGGKLVASIQPNNQNLGNTDVQAYIHTGSVRYDPRQYYHNRNITIKPATTGPYADSVTVRFYFLDSETEALINATGCSGCTKPAMAAELGVTKYSDPDDNVENGNLSDNINGIRSFLSASWNHKVPFDKGYYIEFKTLDFSEFWLNNGWTDGQTPLPVELLSFTAKKKNEKDVLVEWKTASEFNVNRFELEVAKGNHDYQNGRFIKIAEKPGLGNSNTERNYSYTDTEPGKSGVRYYRLRIVDHDGSIDYSPIRPVLFNNEMPWQVYPNPSDGLFSLVQQLPEGEIMNLKVYDVNGKLVKQNKVTGTGFIQKTMIDLRSATYPGGIYLLSIEAGDKKQTFRLLKQ